MSNTAATSGTMRPVSTRTRQAERTEETRAALIAAARGLFGERGYAAVGTEEIVEQARVTRGALYHHFDDKRDLFRAVFEQVESELVASIGERIGGISDPVELLLTGMRDFLDACLDPRLSRISLVDAPSVLGYAEWREIDARYGLGLIIVALQGAIDAGVLRPTSVRPLAHLLMAALSEAGLLIAHSDDPAATRAEVEPPLIELLEGLRA